MDDTSWVPAFDRLTDPAPHARLLANGRYAVLLTSAGTGVSSWNGVQLTGWSADRVEDRDGWFIYLRDLEDGRVWSATAQPICDPTAQAASARYAPGVVTLARENGDVASTLEVCVDPTVDAEVRRLTLSNRGDRPRHIEVTTYCEIVLHDPAAHAAHPAFSKLFVETELSEGMLLARRRPRSHDEAPRHLAATLLGEGPLECESARAAFLGRNRDTSAPQALASTAPLAGGSGSVLDPVFAFRRRVTLAPGQTAVLHAIMAAAADRSGACDAIRRGASADALASVFDRAAAWEQDELARAGITPEMGAAYQELAGAIRYGHPALRADGDILRRAAGSMADVWQFAMGGRPYMVAVAEDAGAIPRVEALLTAQAYWLRHGVRTDLMVLCGSGIDPATAAGFAGRQPTGVTVTVRRRDEIPASTVDVVLAAAAFVSTGPVPSLAGAPATRPTRATASAPQSVGNSGPTQTSTTRTRAHAPTRTLLFHNGAGGFSPDGSEYIMHVDGERCPPLAWTNVIANEEIGFLTTESGAAFTWSRNSHEHRLTPWYNDPLADPHGEALYARDDETGVFWSPQPGPAPAPAPYEVRHGFGASWWRHTSHELEQEVVAFVPPRDPVRIVRLRLTNRGAKRRRLSLLAYQRLVIGVTPAESARFVVTEHDTAHGMLVARNQVNGELSGGCVFASVACAAAGTRVTCTTDRAAFIGRNRSPSAPAALTDAERLDGTTGAGLDPCFALQLECEVAPGAKLECAFLFGDGADRAAAEALVARYRDPAAVDAALAETRAEWQERLSAVRVETPEPAIDLMLNGWLLYQATSCRLWGRSALYQSGGAFGFRDQLQDSAALVYAEPQRTRAQILLHAAHQFVEGDVLHWWHPPASRGTRTRFSDDLLWLPYIACFYARVTGDWDVFDEQADFMTAPLLAPGEDEAYLLPAPAGAPATLFEHCCRAVDRSLTRGAHGLPLMGTGDWNDGMNRVGREGRGESVWVGFFLYTLLADVIDLCERRGDAARAQRYRSYRDELRTALNDGGWDGAWYRRAYFDDGAPLGSAENDECQIDAIAQAWCVISGAAPRDRAEQALDAVEQRLVDRDAGLIKLLAPPFDRGVHDPGYIKGYVPGIRENGGQYTHGAMWTVRAFAELGRRDRAAAYLAMLSPVSHTASAERLAVYQVEPYVVVADIYGVAPHVGRGGWTWYTGSAAWMYRIGLESVLGIHLEEGRRLRIRPCIPDTWPGYRVFFRIPGAGSRYTIAVHNPKGCAERVTSATLDGRPAAVEDGAAVIEIEPDGADHAVEVTLGGAAGRAKRGPGRRGAGGQPKKGKDRRITS